jgi:hypothetical protein
MYTTNKQNPPFLAIFISIIHSSSYFVRTDGKGSMQRKKKVVHKATTTDDKRLQSTLKRVTVNTKGGGTLEGGPSKNEIQKNPLKIYSTTTIFFYLKRKNNNK